MSIPNGVCKHCYHDEIVWQSQY